MPMPMFGLRAKIFVGLGGLLAIVLVVSFLASQVLEHYSAATRHMLDQDWASVSACENLMHSADNILAALYRAVRDDLPAGQGELEKHERAFDANLAVQMRSADLAGEAEATTRLTSEWAQFKVECRKALDAGPSRAEREAEFSNVLLPGLQRIKADAHAIAQLNIENVRQAHGSARELGRDAVWAMRSLTVCGVAVAAAFTLLVGRMILRPLRSLTESLQDVQRGKLDLSLKVRSRDELGRLTSAFNSMTSQLRVSRRNDEDRLLRTQRTTQLAIDSLPDGVFVVGPEGVIELANQTARRLLNLRPDMDITQVSPRKLIDLHRRLTQEGTVPQPSGYESTIKLTDGGQDRFFLPKAVPIVGQDGRLVGSTMILADVTGLRRLDEMKSNLLSLVSHELKTPLTSMRMILHLLSEEKIGALSPRQMELLVAARDDSDRLHQIVANLLDMSRIESGKELMDLRSQDAGELAAAAVEKARGLCAERGLALEYSAPPHSAQVIADPTRIGHVLANLLNNSTRYTAAGGRIRLDVRVFDDVVEFAVSDTGVGIPPQFVHRVFEKFFRVPGQPGASGAGLGLAIVKDIVEAHGGQVGVESVEGRGTTFRFTLPRTAAANVEVNDGQAVGSVIG